jgi:hypothetical protein
MAPSSSRNRDALEPILKHNVGNMSLALLFTTSHASTQHHMVQDVEHVPIAIANAPEKSAKLI